MLLYFTLFKTKESYDGASAAGCFRLIHRDKLPNWTHIFLYRADIFAVISLFTFFAALILASHLNNLQEEISP